jgi:phosphatidylglycerol:prolipoprotein diacylglycerol transferase
MIGLTCVLYAPVRFLLDFLRVGDRLYFGFTPGQYFSIALLAVGVVLLVQVYRSPAALNVSKVSAQVGDRR